MLIRIRSKDGNFRFELPESADISVLAEKIVESSPEADPSTITISNQPRGNETALSSLKGRSLKSLGLKHADLIFVAFQSRAAPSTSAPAAAPAQPDVKRPWESVQEDAVDAYWRAQDGLIPRGRDTRLCKHGANAMCDYCMPLEPYDAAYQSEHNIKHLSYHAYLRKLTPKTASASTAALPPLSSLSYKVKIPCPTGHASWPAAICTTCQPSAITLQSQPFRMVDHLEIAAPTVVERFLQAWRDTGKQRFGWLIGHYEPYPEVPMGIKAVVEAIHEPPQEGELDGLTLDLPWPDEARIAALARAGATPLQVVGYVFTDLDPTEEDRTKNVYKRHPGSFFLSSLEAIFAATMQNEHPNASRASPSGVFASRLVTAVLTATADGQVDIAAYQLSEQACAMVDADMIEASVDPGIVRVKPEDRTVGSARYVPDVFFRYKNEYGLEVKKSAKPAFPVEYLLVTLSHGFPQTPAPIFRTSAFPIENRPSLEHPSIEKVMHDLVRLGAPSLHDSRQRGASGDARTRTALATWLSDWHLIAFLGTTQLVSEEDMKTFIHVATAQNLEDPAVLDAVIATSSWQTLMTFAQEMAPRAPPQVPNTTRPTAPSSSSAMDLDDDIPPELLDEIMGAGSSAPSGHAAGGGGAIRVCPHCTFENTHGGDCDVCGLPLD